MSNINTQIFQLKGFFRWILLCLVFIGCISIYIYKLFRIPNSRFFTTRYPQPIVLSSGTSISLPVTFRPLDKVSATFCFTLDFGMFSFPSFAAFCFSYDFINIVHYPNIFKFIYISHSYHFHILSYHFYRNQI